jgi:hypothetical protein
MDYVKKSQRSSKVPIFLVLFMSIAMFLKKFIGTQFWVHYYTEEFYPNVGSLCFIMFCGSL